MVVCPEDGGGGLPRVSGGGLPRGWWWFAQSEWIPGNLVGRLQKKTKIRPKKETIFRKGRDLLRSRILKIGPAGLICNASWAGEALFIFDGDGAPKNKDFLKT